jgi:hypothetical protein
VNFYTSIFNKKIKYKKSVFLILIIFLFIVNIVAFINYIIDPMWIFNSIKIEKLRKLDFDERQQKTNYLYFKNNNYNNVILGSSRTTYLNKNQFNKKLGDTFNYACNAMSPYEFDKFLEYFTKLTKNEPKNIILGLDFFGINKKTNHQFSNKDYMSRTKQLFYKTEMLYNLKVLKFSLKNIRKSFKTKKAYYDINQIKHIPVKNKELLKIQIHHTLKHFKPFDYDEDMYNYLYKLKQKYKNSRFIVFTPAITFDQLILNHKDGLDQYYFRWLKQLVEIYGEVYHFMYISDFTKNITNFYDANHFHDKTGIVLAKDIVNGLESKKMNFGIILNKDNIDKFINKYKSYLGTLGANH